MAAIAAMGQNCNGSIYKNLYALTVCQMACLYHKRHNSLKYLLDYCRNLLMETRVIPPQANIRKTRWVQRLDALEVFAKLYLAVINRLDIISRNTEDTDTRGVTIKLQERGLDTKEAYESSPGVCIS